MSGLRFYVWGGTVSHEFDSDFDYDEDYYYDDVELIYDLGDSGATVSNARYSGTLASSSDAAGPVTLATIHNDLQLLIVTILFVYTIIFVFFLTGKLR